MQLSRSNNPARKLPLLGDYGEFVKAVLRAKIFRMFSADFWLVPAGKSRRLAGIHRKKSGRNTASMSDDFWCFPAGSCGLRWPELSTWVLFHGMYVFIFNIK
jgi:hypothetical protein